MSSSTGSASDRINALLDEKSFVEIGAKVTARCHIALCVCVYVCTRAHACVYTKMWANMPVCLGVFSRV